MRVISVTRFTDATGSPRPSAQGGTPVLFSDLYRVLIVCLFCGDREEGRYMCSKCRQRPLGEMFWLGRAK